MVPRLLGRRPAVRRKPLNRRQGRQDLRKANTPSNIGGETRGDKTSGRRIHHETQGNMRGDKGIRPHLGKPSTPSTTGTHVQPWETMGGMLMLLQGAAASRVLLSRWGVRFGAGMPVAQQGAAVRVVRALWSGPMQVPLQGAAWGCCCQSGASALERACWCRCRVLLLECRVCFGAGLLVLVEGAGGGCCCRVLFRVLLSELRALWRWVQALRGAAVRAMCGFWSCNESGDDWRNAFWDTFLGCIFLGWPECKKYTFSASPNAFFWGEMRKSNKQNQVTAKLADGPRIWGG